MRLVLAALVLAALVLAALGCASNPTPEAPIIAAAQAREFTEVAPECAYLGIVEAGGGFLDNLAAATEGFNEGLSGVERARSRNLEHLREIRSKATEAGADAFIVVAEDTAVMEAEAYRCGEED